MVGYSFTVLPARGEEISDARLPSDRVQELSRNKAKEVFAQVKNKATEQLSFDPDHFCVIAADTLVAYNGNVLGKPKDEKDALQMLSLLSAQTHAVYTGVTLMGRFYGTLEEVTFYEKTKVTFYPLRESDIRAYIATKEPMDKAGAYAIQGQFAVHIKEIAGDYYNVVGLPVARLHQVYRELLDKNCADETKTDEGIGNE